MPFFFSKKRQIQDELQSHVDDLVDELVHEQHISIEQAQRQAQRLFGDFQTHVQAVEKVYPVSALFRFGPVATIVMVYSMLSVLLSISYGLFSHTISGSRLEPVLLWWVFLGVIGLMLIVNQWILEFSGLLQPRVLVTSFIFSGLVGLSITRIMDINNFEEVVHAVIVGVGVFVAMEIFWKKTSILLRQLVAHGFCISVVWSTLTQQPLLGFVGQAQCLYLKPDSLNFSTALQVCSQVPWLSTILLPIYGLMLIGIPYMVWFMFGYWRNRSTFLYRKMVYSFLLLCLPVAPVLAHDINSRGQLDIIPWKREIYQTYKEVLGRKPQEKDIQFYAETKAYTNMQHVRAVLLDSYERRLKIRLVYVEELGREPTEEELNFFVQGGQTVQDIRQAIH